MESKYDHILSIGKWVIEQESSTLREVGTYLGESFIEAVNVLINVQGKVVFTGVGKSAIACQKISATFNSLGIPSILLHATDAIHGDMGCVSHNDVVIAISKSGDTPELKVLIPFLKNLRVPIISITSNKESFLARNSTVSIYVPVEKEACPLNITPTTSVIAHIAVGDALAMTLLKLKGITREDFSRNHPGGIIGKKLYLKVRDVLQNQKGEKPFVFPTSKMPEVILSITEGRLGASVVIENQKIVGIITDGDIRRMLQKYPNWSNLTAADIMTPNPKTIDIDELAVNALHIINTYKITQIVCVKDGKYEGLLHFHDLIREGII